MGWALSFGGTLCVRISEGIMTLSDLGSLGEAISGLAVVLSLLYVAYELRMNTRTSRAVSAAASQDSTAAFNEFLAGQPDLLEIYLRAADRGTLAGLAPEEALRVTLSLRSLLQRYESMFFRYEAGLMEERVWETRRNWMAGFLKTSLASELWSAERQSSLYTSDFVNDIDSVSGIALDPTGKRSA